MKKIIFFTLYISVISIFYSCSHRIDDHFTEFILEKPDLMVSYQGGKYDLPFQLLNGSDQEEILVINECGWINTTENITGENILTIDVSENNTNKERISVITLVYGNYLATKDIVITQSPSESSPFQVTLESKGKTELVFNIIPQESTGMYILSCETDRRMGPGFIKSDKQLLDSLIQIHKENAKIQNKDISEYLHEILDFGHIHKKFSNLYPSTGYTLLVAEVSDDGSISDNIYKQTGIRTDDIEKIDISFTIDFESKEEETEENTIQKLIMQISPDKENLRYYYNAIPKSNLERLGMTIDEFAKEEIFSLMDDARYRLNYTITEAVNLMTAVGKDSTEYNITGMSNDSIIGYAFALSEEGVICSDIIQKEYILPK